MATDSIPAGLALILVGVDPALRSVCTTLRQLIVRLHPPFVEIVWERQRIASYGLGPKKMSEHYAYIAPQKAHVNLGFYHGVVLADPDGLLEGTGKRLRHVKLRSVDMASSAPIEALVVAAIAEREEALG